MHSIGYSVIIWMLFAVIAMCLIDLCVYVINCYDLILCDFMYYTQYICMPITAIAMHSMTVHCICILLSIDLNSIIH